MYKKNYNLRIKSEMFKMSNISKNTAFYISYDVRMYIACIKRKRNVKTCISLVYIKKTLTFN